MKRPALIAFYNVDYDLDPKGTQYWRNRVMKGTFGHNYKNDSSDLIFELVFDHIESWA